MQISIVEVYQRIHEEESFPNEENSESKCYHNSYLENLALLGDQNPTFIQDPQIFLVRSTDCPLQEPNQSYTSQVNQFDSNQNVSSDNDVKNQASPPFPKIKQLRKKSKGHSLEPKKPSEKKNVIRNLYNKIMGMIFAADFQATLTHISLKWQVDVQHYKKHYEHRKTKVFGPNTLIPFLRSWSEENINEVNMLVHLMQQILRKHYMIKVATSGRMDQLLKYIKIKNQRFLYFRKLLEQQK